MWWVLFRPPWCCGASRATEGHWTWLGFILDFWYPGPSWLCRRLLCFTFLFVFSVPYTKKKRHWRVQCLADTKPHFSTILQFSSEMSKTSPWIYCTGQRSKASSFPGLFFCLSSLCSQLLHHGLYLSFAQVFCPSTLAPLCHLPSRMLTAFFSRVCLPVLGHVECLLALIVPKTLMFLSSNVWTNLALL